MSPLVVDLLIRALVLLASAWVAVTILRRRSASLRALVWTAALAGVLVLPIVTATAPALEVPVWQAEPASVVAPPVAPVQLPAVRESRLPGEPEVDGERPRHAQAAAATVEVPASVERSISWGQLALLAWSLVTFVLALKIAASHFTLSRLARAHDPSSDERDAAWTPLVNETRRVLGIRRAVRVRTTDAIGVPAVAGLLTPVLMLPAEADDWHDDVKRAVVLHELAHVARWDAAGQLVSQLACAVYWFVPLAWHGARRAAMLREQASDDVVLMSGVRASAYAANLLNVARLTGNTSLEPATLAMANPRRIRERIVAILDPASTRAVLRARSLTAVIVTAAATVALVATIQPTTLAAVPVPAGPGAVAVSSFVQNSIAGTPDPAVTSPPVIRTDASLTAPVALSAPVMAAGQAASLGPCERDLDRSSSSINDDGKEKRWRVSLSSPSCKVDLKVDGDVTFNDSFTDVLRLSRGGTFRLDVTESGVRRELEIEERSGQLTRLYRVDGRERAFDSEGQRWFAGFLVTLDRRTAVAVDTRLPALLRQGGVAAVLKETALMYSDYPRSRYYEKLMAARQLTDSERAQVLRQVASMTRSDHYASEILKEAGRGSFDNPEVRAAALAILDTMDSDHYRSEAVTSVVGNGRPSAGDMDVLVRTVERVKSDHYKLEILRRLVEGPLQPQHRAALSRAARTVESDHYAAEFLKALLKSGAGDANRDVLFDVIETIESDHYVLEVLRALVSDQTPSRSEFQQGVRVLAKIESDHYAGEAVASLVAARDLTEADLLTLVAATAGIGGDHYKSESLLKIVRHRAAGERVRSAVIDASARMSSHYREEVRRAAGR